VGVAVRRRRSPEGVLVVGVGREGSEFDYFSCIGVIFRPVKAQCAR